MNYLKFASKISFFEFLQEEFYSQNFVVSNYKEEFNVLDTSINIEKLTNILKTQPKTFDIFESFFQLRRFTNAQYIHFLFDVFSLNNSENDVIIKYANKSIFKFENALSNENFYTEYNKFEGNQNCNDTIVLNIKRTIPKYVSKCVKKRELLYNHISNSIGTRLRISKYLIETLLVDDYLKTVDISNFLKLKRINKDTKSLHGKFGTIKIENVLNNSNISCIDEFISDKTLPLSGINLPTVFSKRIVFCKEKYVEKVVKRTTGKHKKFDFVLIYNGKPIFLIETNFYSTSGTKIGINENEYINLKEDVDTINSDVGSNLHFSWITDGNYWLSKNGEERFNNLKSNYFTKWFELLNYNLFQDKINDISNLILKNG